MTTHTGRGKAAKTSKAGAQGRAARTKGVSMLPGELKDAATLEQLTGVGFSELFHRHFSLQIKAAADLLLEARDAGLEVNRAVLRDTWSPHMSADELTAVYTARSELIVGE